MDEVQFTREALKRGLTQTLAALGEAEEHYDPADEVLAADIAVLLGSLPLRQLFAQYGDAVISHTQANAEANPDA